MKRLTMRSSSEWYEMTARRPSGTQRVDRPTERHGQCLELAVDRDSECLEDARGGMNAAAPARRSGRRARDYFRELRTGRDRLTLTLLDDGAGYPASVRFFAISTEKVTQLLFVEIGDQLARRSAARGVEAHVERPFSTKAEGALGVGELVGAQAEVEQDAVCRCEALLGGDVGQFLEVRLTQRHSIAELGESIARSGDGRPIGI